MAYIIKNITKKLAILSLFIYSFATFALAKDAAPLASQAQEAQSNLTPIKNAPASFADLVDKLTPSVVNISSTQTLEGVENPFEGLFNDKFPGGSPFSELPEMLEKFYGQKNQEQNGQSAPAPAQRKATSLGSGFIIDAEGYIVTNYHVIEKAEEIVINFSDGTTAKAKVIGKDAKTDLALVKVETKKKLPALEWGDSDKARVGDWVIAIGNPFGLGGSVSAGIISARARDINAGPFDDFIQTDAAINRGNSGGPLFDMNGKVIGVNAAIFSPSGGNVGIGFAIPSSMSWPVIKQLKEEGRTHRGWLGVKIQTVTPEIAESLGLKDEHGALVLDITKDSPAAKAGVVAGDIIITFDGHEVQTMRKLPRIVADTKPGKKVPMEVLRKGEKKTLLVTINELKEEEDTKTKEATNTEGKKEEAIAGTKKIFGLELAALDAALKKKFNVDNAVSGVVIVSVDKNSDAAQKGLQRGDVITAINQENVADLGKAVAALEKAKSLQRKSVLLLVSRSGDSRFVALGIEK